MSSTDLDNSSSNNDGNRISQEFKDEIYSLLKSNQQVRTRQLSKAEKNITKTINTCLRNWHDRWIDTFLSNRREFTIVYDLMDGLLHYEYQITSNDSHLSEERTNAIARAVARLVDYGNSLLNIDLIIRKNDEASSEIDPVFVTTIGLYHAHTKAHKLREKLLYDYFKKDKPNSSSIGYFEETTSHLNNGPSAHTTLQVPSVMTSNQSPRFERRHRISIGSNSSINLISDGRKTPQQISPPSPSLPSPIDFKESPTDSASQLEIEQLKATIKSDAFCSAQDSKMRLALLPGIIEKIENFLTAPTSTDKIVNCFELLDTLLDSIEKLPIESRQNEVLFIATHLIKPIVRKIYIDDRDNLVEFQQAHWTTCLISMIRLMTASDFNAYLKHFTNLADLGAFLKDYLFIAKRLVLTSDKTATNAQDIENINSLMPTYPECWIEMILLASSIFLKSLTYLYQVLRQLFATNLQMWLSFIDCLIHIILQDTLKPGKFMLKKRQNLLAEDLRQTSAEYIWISWDSLSHDHKKQLLEDLIEPLLRASIVLQTRQRSILLPIFYDMMRCDYTSQYVSQRITTDSSSSFQSKQFYSKQDPLTYEDDLESLPPINHSTTSRTNDSLAYVSNELSDDSTVLTKFTHLIIGRLNTLMFDSDLGDEHFKNELCAALSGQLNPKYYDCKTLASYNDTGRFRAMAGHTSDLIAEFIQICLDSREANDLEYKHLYLLCLFKLVLFFRDKVDRIDLYLSNLYKLFYLHHTARRYIEAGYTLLEHAKTLPWDEKPLENHFRIITRYFQSSQQLTDYSSLKSFLYNTIIEYFDQGQLWEAAIPLCRELSDMYQFRTLEYSKLAEILQKMSTYFTNITDINVRNNPEYFRVTFYGIGFPKCIRNSTMIYRGKPYEKLGDFQALMLTKYSDCKLLNSLAKPDNTLLNEEDAKYLQINACTPLVDLKTKFSGKNLSSIGEFILNYYRCNECDKFQFSRRIDRPSEFGGPLKCIDLDNFANMWRERTILTTNTLPGMLSFFQVFLIESNIVSPIESAIEDLERTNDRLSCMVNRFKVDKRQVEDIRLLGQLLLGIVDAAVNGGITKYETAFFTATSTELESNFDGLQINNHDKQQSVNNMLQKQQQQRHQRISIEKANIAQVDKLKSLIAHQVPLLDEAIRLHRDRVADVMRPQHEHLEASYKKLKHHIMTKYSRFLPSDYSRSTMRPYRSLARSPNRSIRSESRVPFMMPSSGRSTSKRMSDVGTASSSMAQKTIIQNLSPNNDSNINTGIVSTNIPYKQLNNERRSLPSLTTTDTIGEGDKSRAFASVSLVKTDRNFFDISKQISPASFNPRFVSTDFGDRLLNLNQYDQGNHDLYLCIEDESNKSYTANNSPGLKQSTSNIPNGAQILCERGLVQGESIVYGQNKTEGSEETARLADVSRNNNRFNFEENASSRESEETNLVLL